MPAIARPVLGGGSGARVLDGPPAEAARAQRTGRRVSLTATSRLMTRLRTRTVCEVTTSPGIIERPTGAQGGHEMSKSKSKVKPIPAGYHSATPYLIVDGAAKALDFSKRAFAARERMRMPAPGGKRGHAEITIRHPAIILPTPPPPIPPPHPPASRAPPVSGLPYGQDVAATGKPRA